MHAFDCNENLKHYQSVDTIIDEFCEARLEGYVKRKEKLEREARFHELRARNKERFISEIISGDIALISKEGKVIPRKKLIDIIESKGYNSQEDFDNILNGISEKNKISSNYSYLVDMPIHSLTIEEATSLRENASKLYANLQKIIATSPKDMWLEDIRVLKEKLESIFNVERSESK